MVLGLRVYRVQDVGSGLRVWGWGFSVVVLHFLGCLWMFCLSFYWGVLLGLAVRLSSSVLGLLSTTEQGEHDLLGD